ncbi:MAG TPA: TetR/AcrR family transcriptional regulator [Saprospiraceae bacterium]|nr:TetR/AcrR family transcriptional regulator [Saprospiraceae bacterium]
MRLRDEKKEEIVRKKALELLVQLGFDGFSMQKLAKAAGVSPATLYIYYKDKEDLILRIGEEVGERMVKATFEGFHQEMDLKTGLWVQWTNRANFHLNHYLETQFYEQLKLTPYKDKLAENITAKFSQEMGGFMKNAVKNGETDRTKPEVFWSVAFAPLYNLIRFHIAGKSMGGAPYQLSEQDMKAAFDIVIKGIKK